MYQNQQNMKSSVQFHMRHVDRLGCIGKQNIHNSDTAVVLNGEYYCLNWVMCVAGFTWTDNSYSHEQSLMELKPCTSYRPTDLSAECIGQPLPVIELTSTKTSKDWGVSELVENKESIKPIGTQTERTVLYGQGWALFPQIKQQNNDEVKGDA